MATTRTREGAVRFRGIPSSLTAVLAVPEMDDVPVTVVVAKGLEIEAVAIPDGDPRVLHLSLPPETPPGRYAARAVLQGKEQAVSVEVEPEPDLRIYPEHLRIEAQVGQQVTVEVSLLNLGNEAVEVRPVHAFGVFMEGGLERAIRRAYVHTLKENERRVDVLGETLADAHGGLVKMRIAKGAGKVPPGGLQELEIALAIPAGVKPGYTYAGNWEVASTVYPVTIVVAGERQEDDAVPAVGRKAKS